LRAELEALLHQSDEEYQHASYDLYLKEEDLLAGPQTEWYLRNWRICRWAERDGLA
jgi:hypothetical protein